MTSTVSTYPRKRLKQNLKQLVSHMLSDRIILQQGTTTFHDEIYGDITVDNCRAG